jgi:hypothetical protein
MLPDRVNDVGQSNNRYPGKAQFLRIWLSAPPLVFVAAPIHQFVMLDFYDEFLSISMV